MTKTPTRSRRLATVLMAGLGATLVFLSAPAPALAQSAADTSAASHASVKPTSKGGTSDFRGVNWADPRDNYASDAVVPSGLSVTDNYRTVYRTTDKMVRGFNEEPGRQHAATADQPGERGHRLVEVVPGDDRRGHGLR
ncbi:hypothetical protein ACGFNV_28990 [Streptomyces sp. NPDC048751]|uniref:hypothetical protein n=1 Tax=Streptomyces sp. NPDC048751 TaxID=3365591 RepID=UPI00371C60D5